MSVNLMVLICSIASYGVVVREWILEKQQRKCLLSILKCSFSFCGTVLTNVATLAIRFLSMADNLVSERNMMGFRSYYWSEILGKASWGTSVRIIINNG